MIGDMSFLMSRDTYLPLIAVKPENSAVSPQHLSPASYETGKPAITEPSHRLSTQPFTTGHSIPSPAMVELQDSTQNLKSPYRLCLQLYSVRLTPHPST